MAEFIAYRADPLTNYVQIVKPDGTPTSAYMQQWNNVVEYLFGSDSEFKTIDEAITSLDDAEIVVGTGLDGGGLIKDGTITISLADTAVTPGTYGSLTEIPSITVDQQGRITGAASLEPARYTPFAPPLAADFSTFIDGGDNNANFVANNTAGAGFLLRAVDVSGGDNNFGLYTRAGGIPATGAETYLARLVLAAGAVGGTPEIGICAADSATGKFATWGLRARLGLAPSIVSERWTAAASGSTLDTTELNEAVYEADIYLQLQVFNNGQATLRYNKAGPGAGWGFVYRWKLTDWITPDRWGFYIRAPNLVSGLIIDVFGLIPYHEWP